MTLERFQWVNGASEDSVSRRRVVCDDDATCIVGSAESGVEYGRLGHATGSALGVKVDFFRKSMPSGPFPRLRGSEVDFVAGWAAPEFDDLDMNIVSKLVNPHAA